MFLCIYFYKGVVFVVHLLCCLFLVGVCGGVRGAFWMIGVVVYIVAAHHRLVHFLVTRSMMIHLSQGMAGSGWWEFSVLQEMHRELIGFWSLCWMILWQRVQVRARGVGSEGSGMPSW